MTVLLDYYNAELGYFRELGNEFSRRYPNVAAKLRLNGSGSDDPHVERLIESFAFIASRIRQKLDDGFPEIVEGMLETLYPQCLAPVPSMGIVQFGLSELSAQLTGGYVVQRGSEVVAEPVDGEPCRFRTVYPVELFPIELASARIEGPPFGNVIPDSRKAAQQVLRLQLRTIDPEVCLSDLSSMNSLRVFLSGQAQYIHELYESLHGHVASIVIKSGDDEVAVILDRNVIRPVGFEIDESVFPTDARIPHTYQLLREYFAFPGKHLFFDLTELSKAIADWQRPELTLEIYFSRRIQHLEPFLSGANFLLGCTPVVNLFSHSAEPIHESHETADYHLVVNSGKPRAFEVYSIDVINEISVDGSEMPVHPLYSIGHPKALAVQQKYYTSARRQSVWSENQSDSGTELYISIVGQSAEILSQENAVLSCELTCTNRDLPARLPFGGDRPHVELVEPGPVAKVTCIGPFTPCRRPDRGRAVLWKLVSQLSLNHLSLTDGRDGAETLREILHVHESTRGADNPFPYNGIVDVSCRAVTRRFRPKHGITATGSEPGFARGTEVTLLLDEEQFVGTGAYLFACVMEQFFSLHCHINTFTTLVLKTRQRGEVCQWLPRSGQQRIS